MKRILLLMCFAVGFCASSRAQGILVNRYYNSGLANGVNDVVELVVYTDHLDIRNYIIKDYGNGGSTLDDGGGKYRFKELDVWKNLRSGTTIVLRKLSDAELLTYTPDTVATDFKISVAINDANIFTNMDNNKIWNLTFHEAVSIRADTDAAAQANGANQAVHTLGYGDFFNKSVWHGITGTKSLYNGSNLASNATVGVAYLTYPNYQNYSTPFDLNADLISLPAYWNKETALMTGFPAGIQVFRTTTPYMGRQMNAYCVVFDPKLVEFKPTQSASLKTPKAFVDAESGTVYACLNAGFFSTVALSTLQYNGTTNASNVASLVRSVYNSQSNTYYPTRGTFGLSSMLKPDITWTYRISNVVYSYATPSPNDVNAAPQPIPLAANGTIWNAISAVGGSPVLVKNSLVNITAAEELADLDNTSQRGRSAIGYTADGKVILLAVEGGNTTVSPSVTGLSLNELANLMKDMGCVGALNLDGGGSTALRINNQATVRPSDSGAERTMPGVILIKSKN